MRKTYFYFFLLFAALASSCNIEVSEPVIPVANGVYICNEGNFGFGNAEISMYDKDTKEATNGLFKSANKYSLGDVAQSFFIRDSIGFIVVNNSGKIEVVNMPSMKKVRTISIPGSSPRYCYALNDSIVYISDLYKGVVYVVNYQSGTIVKEIGSLSRWTEHIILHGDDLLVEERNLDAFPSSAAGVVRINTTSNTIMRHYSFNGSNIHGLVRDKDSRIWILMEEDTVHTINSALLCLNSDLSIHKTIPFPKGHRPSLLRINGTGDQVYYLDGDLYRLNVSENHLPATPFLNSNSRNIYAYDLDPESGDLYLADALDFVQPSRIYHYDKNGLLIHSFVAGVIAGNFTFTNK